MPQIIRLKGMVCVVIVMLFLFGTNPAFAGG